MLEQIVLPLIQGHLSDQGFSAEFLPEEAAYPTSGETFLRIAGTQNLIEHNETSFNVSIGFSIYFARRVRDSPIQERDNHYKEILKTASQVFRAIVADSAIYSAISSGFDFATHNVGQYGKYINTTYNTRIDELYPEFFGSQDVSSTRIAGYGLQHIYFTPTFNVPTDCLELDSAFSAAIDAFAG